MKKLMILTLCVGLLTPALAQTPPLASQVRPFPDVPPGHWAASAVETLHRAGIVKGYPASVKPAPKTPIQTAKRPAKTIKR